MDKYRRIREIGEGSFGSVSKATNIETGEIVAIKKLKGKYSSWEECLNLPEVKSLPRMNHPNIVKLKELVHRDGEGAVYLVFEYMEANLAQIINDIVSGFSAAEIRDWCFQVFKALAHMHQNGYLHRDLKPDNLLITKGMVKVADFGLARETCSQQPCTDYVGTRWYRAPEMLLKSPAYGPAVDMWAMGAIMAELFTLNPLFPGSSEADQIHKMCSVIGSPNENTWPDGLRLAASIKYRFPQCSGVHLSDLIDSASTDALGLISWLCSWDPRKRPTALQALQHPFFQSHFHIPPSLRPSLDVPPGFSPAPNPSAKCNIVAASTIPPGFGTPPNPITKTKYQPPMVLKNSKLSYANKSGPAVPPDLAKKLAQMTLNSGQPQIPRKQVAPQAINARYDFGCSNSLPVGMSNFREVAG